MPRETASMVNTYYLLGFLEWSYNHFFRIDDVSCGLVLLADSRMILFHIQDNSYQTIAKQVSSFVYQPSGQKCFFLNEDGTWCMLSLSQDKIMPSTLKPSPYIGHNPNKHKLVQGLKDYLHIFKRRNQKLEDQVS